MLKRKQAQKIESHFTKLIRKIETAKQKENIILNVARATSFIKALKLVEAIDTFTVETMRSEIFEAEQEAYKKRSLP